MHFYVNQTNGCENILYIMTTAVFAMAVVELPKGLKQLTFESSRI